MQHVLLFHVVVYIADSPQNKLTVVTLKWTKIHNITCAFISYGSLDNTKLKYTNSSSQYSTFYFNTSSLCAVITPCHECHNRDLTLLHEYCVLSNIPKPQAPCHNTDKSNLKLLNDYSLCVFSNICTLHTPCHNDHYSVCVFTISPKNTVSQW